MFYSPTIKTLPLTPVSRSIDWRNGVLLRGTNWLGDALMTLPATYQLKQLMPANCRLVAFSPAGLAKLWKACPWIDDVVSFPGKHPDKQAIQAVRQMDLGLAVVFPNSFASAWDVRKTGIPRRLGRRGRWRSFLLTDTIPEWKRSQGSAEFHQLSYYLQLVGSLGNITWKTDCPPLTCNHSLAEKLGMSRDENWLALAPGAAFGPAKQWPDEAFAAVARWHSARGGKIVIVGTAKERPNAAVIMNDCPGALDLTGKTSLDELMAVLGTVKAVVANDSGAMHLAAALGTPGVAIFGSTDPVATGPIGRPWQLFVPDIACRPCFKRICPRPEGQQYACLRQTSAEQVIAALKDLF